MQDRVQLNRLRRVLAACWLMIPLVVASCAEQDGVRSYTAEDLSIPRAAPLSDPAADAEPGVAWFFKMQGDPESVDANREAFGEVVGSVEFDSGGSPDWTVPEGWTQRGASGMRVATLTPEGDSPSVELAIFQFPAQDPTSEEYLKQNLDRWRTELSLEPYPDADWRQGAIEAGELREPEQTNGQFFLAVLEGTGTKDKEGLPLKTLAAIFPRPAGDSDQGVAGQPPSNFVPESAEPEYTAPAEWNSDELRFSQVAHWKSGDGDGQADISVSAAGGGVEANIDRWRGQVGLTPSDTGDEFQTVTEISVDGYTALRVELNGPEKATISIIVPSGSQQWFLKLTGSTAAVQAERERFDAFVESVSFK